MRLCNRCNAVQPLSEFGKNSGMADGYLNQCKSCRRVYCSTYRAANTVAIKAYQRSWEHLPHNKAKTAARLAQWRADHPDRRHAQVTTNNAIRDGRLVPQLCWVCGNKAEAHHPDYSRPLDIVWLCKKHHKEVHALVETAA